MTTQPAGEHHTGSLNLAGEGNEAEAGRDPILEAALIAAGHTTLHGHRNAQMQAAIDAVTPLLRRQIAEEIAVRADQIAENYQATAVAHRDLSDSQTPKGQRHTRTAHAFRNKSDGAWAVAHAVREIGAR